MNDRRTMGFAAILVALGPILFFAIFMWWAGAGLSQSDGANPTIAFAFLRAHPWLLLAPTLDSIVMHVAAIVLAVGLWFALREDAPLLATIGAILGTFWGAADIAQSLVTYNAIVGSSAADPVTVDVVTKGLQNAGHLGGGLWTLTVVAASGAIFGRAHRMLGALAGIVFALHAVIVPAVPQWFYLEYLLLPLWFGWTGVAILRSPATARADALTPAYS